MNIVNNITDTVNNSNNDLSISNQIKDIFNQNKINDLKKFFNKRDYLNRCNVYMIYIFHLVQFSGILINSIGASLSDKTLIWTGISLNMCASIIQIYEKINDNQLKILLNDIENIKNNKYTDEGALIDIDKNKNTSNNYSNV
jgi:hypothetical protein